MTAPTPSLDSLTFTFFHLFLFNFFRWPRRPPPLVPTDLGRGTRPTSQGRDHPRTTSVCLVSFKEKKKKANKTIKYLSKTKPRPHLWNLIVEGLWHFSPPPIFAAPLPSGGVLTVNITTIFTALNDLSLPCLQFEKWFYSSVMIPVLADTFSYPKPWCSHKRNKEAKRQVMNIWQI